MARTWGFTSLWWLNLICGLRVEFRGEENIPSTGYILASKHQSFLETFSLITKTPDFAIILKRSLLRIPLFGQYLARTGVIGIDRAKGRTAMQQLVDQAVPILKAGRQIYIYPEGTRRRPGAPPQYKKGVAILYDETGAPCLPVAVNTGSFWGRDSFLKKPGVAVIEFLPVIPGGMEARGVFPAVAERHRDGVGPAAQGGAIGAGLTRTAWAAYGAEPVGRATAVFTNRGKSGLHTDTAPDNVRRG